MDSVLQHPFDHPNEEVVSPIDESCTFSMSEQVPQFVSRVTAQDNLNFILKSTSICFYEMRIPNVNKILDERMKINSPPFMVTLKGMNIYRVCMQIRFGEHISVALAIMKGENDRAPGVSWPFNRNVVFRLVSLHGDGKSDKLKAFRTDTNGSRLKNALSRPKTTINPPMGFPMFLPQQCLQQDGFIKDNSICVQCLILPKEVELTHPPEMPVIIK